MRTTIRIPATLCVVALLSGCQSVPYNPATSNDITPPDIGLRVTGDAQISVWDQATGQFTTKIPIATLDVGAYVPGTAVTPIPVPIHEHGEAVLLATAQDNESGVQSLVLTCQRRVSYNYDPAGPTQSEAVLEIKTTDQTNQITNGQAPLSALTQQIYNMYGQMVFANAAGTATRGHRVSRTCSAEAKNFRGQSVRTKAVIVWAQDHAVEP